MHGILGKAAARMNDFIRNKGDLEHSIAPPESFIFSASFKNKNREKKTNKGNPICTVHKQERVELA